MYPPTNASRKTAVSSRWCKTISSSISGSSRRRCSTRSTRTLSVAPSSTLLPLPKQLLYVRHRAEQLRRLFQFRNDRHTRHNYYKDDRLVEFKYFKAKEAEHMLALNDPRPEDVAQVRAYAKDTKQKFPVYNVRSYIVYICANKGWKCWEVTE